MLLTQVSDSLKKMGRGSVKDIADAISADTNALRGMLGMLEEKGRVRRVLSQSSCGSCNRCDPAQNEIYEWTGR